MWEQGWRLCPSAGDSRPWGECTDPWQKGHRQPLSSGKNAGIRAAICSGMSPPCTTHGFRKGSFGKHLQAYGSFLSQDFFNLLCFLVCLGLEGGAGVKFRGELFGFGWGVRLCLQKAQLEKKEWRAEWWNKEPQSSLFPTHVPCTEIRRTNTPLFLMMALPSIIN